MKKQENQKGIHPIHTTILLIVLGISVYLVWTIDFELPNPSGLTDEQQQQINEFMALENRCEANKFITNETHYDLIKDYDYTCKEIEFVIDHWVEEISYKREYAGGGLFSSRYETVEKYYGVGSIQLLKDETKYGYAEECGKSASHTSIYLEADWVNYYLEEYSK